jgi:hypothetical protein
MTVDREKFFAGLRQMLGGRLTTGQVESAEAILSECEAADLSNRQIAYIFATAIHETARTLEPIKERRAKSGTALRPRQDRYWLTGYYGRGFVQLTWKKNYARAGEALGVDLVGKPDLALDRKIAAAILVRGMIEGWFTGKRLAEFVNGKADYINARRVVNGLDKAEEIAQIARRIEQFTQAAEPEQPAVVTAPPPTKFLSKLKTTLAGVAASIGGIAGIKELLGLQPSDFVVQILVATIPTLIVVGFVGLIVWYVAEKIIGWKTLKLQAEIAANRETRDIVIEKQ